MLLLSRRNGKNELVANRDSLTQCGASSDLTKKRVNCGEAEELGSNRITARPTSVMISPDLSCGEMIAIFENLGYHRSVPKRQNHQRCSCVANV
jgi:hypothetical protein